jgi:hypothetical protein
MTTREQIHKMVDALPESELEPVAEILGSHTLIPHKHPIRGTSHPIKGHTPFGALRRGAHPIRGTSHPEGHRQEGTPPAGAQAGKPGDIIDEWGNLSAMTRASAGSMLQRMDEEEVAEFGEMIADAWGYETPS